MLSRLILLSLALLAFEGRLFGDQSVEQPVRRERMEVNVTSSLDESVQPSQFIASTLPGPQPLLVLLHQWSGDYRQAYPGWHEGAAARGWHVLQPNFRGPNSNPDACASPLARQDILDAVAHVVANYEVDPRRVYLAGESGGGHMAMVMAGQNPQSWSAVSAWVGLSDLTAWYRESTERATRYVGMMEAVMGGAPGHSPAVDEQYRRRSPLKSLENVGDLPIELNAGIHDGHDGRSVPVSQTLHAFNAIAAAHGEEGVSDEDITRFLNREVEPLRERDAFIEVPVYLIRQSGNARCVLFEGGHEGIPEAAFAFLESHKRTTDWQRP